MRFQTSNNNIRVNTIDIFIYKGHCNEHTGSIIPYQHNGRNIQTIDNVINFSQQISTLITETKSNMTTLKWDKYDQTYSPSLSRFSIRLCCV